MVRAPEKFVKQTLWPEFQELQDTLVEHLNAVADRILKEVVDPDTAEAKEVDAPRQLSSGGR
jgi:ABC-type ATPase with predicted acetyltransferase domain